MNTGISYRPLSVSLFIALSVSYVLCIAGDAWLGWRMVETWAPLLPGFTWPLTAAGFFVGLIWIVIYSLYGAALVSIPYNYFSRRAGVRETMRA